ncbi:Low conductance mechanosensitive channel YnaI [Methyloligella halotolerans]|uniref:Low conductance mechanosensitive channel YnaI n=1 Tax=Methyloligella halotolerans TaxID=1177755 RepID=A0A1E2S0G0_9HYPH|nr:mechanosensitive ion channel family protein [Methyloligella halotolerans]ODA67951.1 Low conductance mechanosensitive channel YnaI [Methyloligella halotolerans]
MLQFLENEIYGNIITLWIMAAIIIAVTASALMGLRIVLLKRLPKPRPEADMAWAHIFADLVERLSTIFIVIASIYAGSTVLALPNASEDLIETVFVIALFLQCALWADRIARAGLVWRFASTRTKAPIRSAISLMQALARVTIWSLALLLILDNVGFDITALIAGLGIGGVAVALAAQNVLGDLFSSLAIVLDRPFEVGDFIVFGDQAGNVEKIGIKTTRIRSLSGEQIVCANSDLITTRIHNYKRMAERRIVFAVGVVYDTPPDTLEAIPGIIEEVIENADRARFDRAHFASYGDSSLNFEVVFYVLSEDYNVYMDVQQAINFGIFRAFGEHGIDFAFPTRTLHLQALDSALQKAGGRVPVHLQPALDGAGEKRQSRA